MRTGLEGRVAVVSGGSRGIGLAIATMLATEGASVVIAGRDPSSLDAAAERIEDLAPGRVEPVVADMTTAEGVANAVGVARSRFGAPAIAVSNVIGHVIDAAREGKGPGAGTFATIDVEDHQEEFQRLFVSAWMLAVACLPDMSDAGWGRIVNVGSIVAREPATQLPHVLPNVVRPAVAGLYRVLAARVAPRGVTVNSVLTGGILTERNRSYWTWLAEERGTSFEEVTSGVTQGIPLRRQGEPEEMAALVTFLCSEQAGGITGQAIPVDGGVSRHL